MKVLNKLGIYDIHQAEPMTQHEYLKKQYEDAVEKYMDSVVATRGYNSVDTCIGKYMQSPNPKYRAEAQAVNVWNTECWDKCYEVLDKVEAEEIPLPSIEEFIETMLPKLEW